MNWIAILMILFSIAFYFKNRKMSNQLDNIKDILNGTEAGILKRLDENRELLELLYREAPNLMKGKPWVRCWIESQDIFLIKLVEVVNIKTQYSIQPRNFPDKR